MIYGRCEKGVIPAKLCPLSFGLAVGAVSFFSVLIWTVWAMHYGMPAMMVHHMPTLTLSNGFVHALYGLMKGFVFGFFVALFYDLFVCGFACLRRGSCEDSGEKK